MNLLVWYDHVALGVVFEAGHRSVVDVVEVFLGKSTDIGFLG